MDPITHASLGVTLAEAGFRERMGGKAVFFSACCAALPDLDIFARAFGEWASLVHHRGITHSFFFLALVSPFLAWAGFRWGKKGNYLSWLLLTFLSLSTHSLIDFCTSYGTQIFAPLTDRRFALDAVAILDFFYTVPLMVVLLFACTRKFSDSFKRNFARAVLLFTTLYLCYGFVQSKKAIALAEKQLNEKGISYSKVRALPTLLNVWLWRIVARDEQGNIRLGMVSTLSPSEIDFREIKWVSHPLVTKALQSERGQIFEWFAMGLISVSVEDAPLPKVYVYDQRYGFVSDLSKNLFGICVQFDENGNLTNVQRTSMKKRADMKKEISIIWEILTGKKTE